MLQKRLVLMVLFAVLCFAGAGCVVRGENPYYDEPYRDGGGMYYYYNGGFYIYDGGAYHFHHKVPHNERGYYEERHRQNYTHYKHEHPDRRDPHSGHSDAPPKDDDRRREDRRR